MKLKYGMTTMEIDGDYMAVPMDSERDFKGILRMNGTTADILEKLKEDITEDALVRAMLAEYDAGEAEMRRSVRKVLDILRSNSLLIE